MDVIAIEYPGHGLRSKEPLCENMHELAEDMVSMMKLKGDLDRPYSLLGYSMGTIVALAVYELLAKRGYRKPQNMFLAAHFPSSNSEYLRFKDAGMEKRVQEYVLEFGGIPNKVQNNATFWRVYLPIYQADFYAIGTYCFTDKKAAIDVPVVIFYAEDDTPYARMVKWKDYFGKECNFVCYNGNHFFIQAQYKNMAQVIKREIYESGYHEQRLESQR